LSTRFGWTIDVAASYLSNEFDQYLSFDPDLGENVDLSSVTIPDLTPDYTLNVSAAREYGLANGTTLTPRIGVYWQDEYDYLAGQVGSTPGSGCLQRAYDKFNARLTWASRNGDRRLSLFGTNVDDEIVIHTCLLSGITGRRVQLEAPSRWGLEVSFAF